MKHDNDLAQHPPQTPHNRLAGWSFVAGFLLNSLPHFLVSFYYTRLFLLPGLFFHIPLLLANALLLAVFCALFKPTPRVTGSYVLGCGANFIVSLPAALGFTVYADLREQNVTLLHLSAEFGQSAAAKMLIRRGADVNAPDKSERTPVYYAAESGHLPVLQTLLAAGADIHRSDSIGISPLGRAAACGRFGALVALKERGADIGKRDRFGNTPVAYATANGHADVVKTLVAWGVDLDQPGDNGWTPLAKAALAGNVEILQLLIAGGADIDKAGPIGGSPLDWGKAQPAIVRALLQAGADINRQDTNGMSPLATAAAAGKRETVELLLTAGADIDLPDRNGHPPIWHAASGGHSHTVTRLMEAGARFDSNQLCEVALRNGRHDTAALLIQKGANINHIDKNGNTYLSFLAWTGGVESDPKQKMSRLLALGADINLPDGTGHTPLTKSAKDSKVGSLNALLELGADIDKADSEGRTALSHLAEHGDFETVQKLIDAGADPGKPDARGKTPADWAAPRSIRMVEMLRRGKTVR